MTEKTIGDIAIEHYHASQRWTHMAMMNRPTNPDEAEAASVRMAEAAKSYYETLVALEHAIGGPFSGPAIKRALRNEFVMQDVLTGGGCSESSPRR